MGFTHSFRQGERGLSDAVDPDDARDRRPTPTIVTVPIGTTGTVRVRISGAAEPGEVELPVRGGFERFLAYADAEIAEGSEVIVIELAGGRAVRVAPLSL